MTHLRIEQSTSGNEYVTSDVIHKLYETAKGILDEEALNEVEESQVSLQGSLVVPKAYGDEVDWLETKFPDLHITAGARYIRFADPEVLRVLLANNIGDETGVTEADAAAVTYIDGLFYENTTVTSFNELRYFTGGVQLLNGTFKGTTNLQSIDLSTVSFLSERCFRSSGITGVINLPNITSMLPSAFDNCKNITEINFGPLLTSMANNTCAGCSNLQKVTGLSNKTTVPEGMFSDCLKLSNIDIDFSKVTSIGGAAFQNCKLLSNLDLSDVVSIGSDAFRGCTSLTNVDLSSCTSIGQNAFNNCSQLTCDLSSCDFVRLGNSCFRNTKVYGDVNLSNITSLGVSVFVNTDIKSITLPNSITTIDALCTGCSKLESINLENITTIGYDSFIGCTKLNNINTTNVTSLGNLCFVNCTSLTHINLPNLINAAGSAFDNCTSLTTAVIGNSNTTSIPSFEGCTSLSSLTINFGQVTTIPPTFLRNCAQLHGTLDLPNTITSISYDAFWNCGIETFIIRATTPPTLGGNAFNDNNGIIYVPDTSINDYKTAANWSIWASRIKGISELPST